MLTLVDFENKTKLASSANGIYEMYCVQWGKSIWRFYLHNDDGDNGLIGEVYTSKKQLMLDAYDYIMNRSGYGNVFENGLTSSVKKVEPIYISKEQADAIRSAIDLLSYRSSDMDNGTVVDNLIELINANSLN